MPADRDRPRCARRLPATPRRDGPRPFPGSRHGHRAAGPERSALGPSGRRSARAPARARRDRLGLRRRDRLDGADRIGTVVERGLRGRAHDRRRVRGRRRAHRDRDRAGRAGDRAARERRAVRGDGSARVGGRPPRPSAVARLPVAHDHTGPAAGCARRARRPQRLAAAAREQRLRRTARGVRSLGRASGCRVPARRDTRPGRRRSVCRGTS